MIRTHVRRLGESKILALGLLVAALVALSLMLTAKPAHAAAKTFTVNFTAFDAPDLSIALNGRSDGVCDADFDPGEQCTLRAAIQEANATSGADTIRFNIPGTGVKTISPTSELPQITSPLTIDGYSQPGSRPNSRPSGALDAVLLVELGGSSAGDADGLDIRASNVVVRGLAINRFSSDGIEIGEGASGVRFEGNFIGTDATGTLDRAAPRSSPTPRP